VPSYLLMQPMATTASFVRDSKPWDSPTRSAFSLRLRCGHRAASAATQGKMGRPPRLLRSDKQHQPLPAKEIALCLTAAELRSVTWREGTRGSMRSRFAALRVRVAHRDYWRNEPHPEQWLLIEWPAIEKEPTKCWLSNLPASISLRKLVDIAKLRWRIERA
jgi:SRSO17 transposase